jgi:chorismate synthase
MEFGSGFAAAESTGSRNNDSPRLPPQRAEQGVPFTGNNAGGSLGGISNGMDICFRAVFKPPASVALSQKTVDRGGTEQRLCVRGRHDVCIVPRAVPVVEAMAALVIADLALMQRCARL